MIDLKKDIEIGIFCDPDEWKWEDVKKYTKVSVRVLIPEGIFAAVLMVAHPKSGESYFFNMNGEFLGMFAAMNNPYNVMFANGIDNVAKLRNKEAISEGI